MNVNSDISEELRSLSALVATISRETPYRAPEDYFLDFPTAVLKRIQPGPIKIAGEASDIAGLEGPENVKPLTFSVPEGYFEGFAQQVLNRIKTGSGPSTGKEEEETLPAILVQAGKINPYTVPQDYFEGLSPILAILKDKNPYLVPTAYFDTVAKEITHKLAGRPIAEQPIAEQPVAKQPITEQPIAEQPITEQPIAEQPIAEQPIAQRPIAQQPKTRVISLGKRMSWMKYAAAAVVAGLIVTVGWLRWHPGPTGTHTQLAAAKTTTPAEMMKSLSRVSDAELQNYLVDQDTTLAQPVGNIGLMATVDMDDTNLKTLLGDVTDGELKQYLDEHGGAGDIATN